MHYYILFYMNLSCIDVMSCYHYY